MKAVEVHDLDDPHLVDFIARSRQELFHLRFQHATGQLENYSRLGQLRRDVARLSSIQRERELGIGHEPEPEEVERSRRRHERDKEEDDADAPRRRRGLRRGRGEEAEAGESDEATEASEEAAGEVEEEQ